MKKYYPSIQVLRAVLFLCVLAFHAGVPLADFGWGGVEAFFVISSFFLVKKHYNREFDFGKQFIHRIRRLYPPYIAVVVVATILIVLMKRYPIDLPYHVLSLQNFYWMRTNYSSALQPFTAHTWTLVIEVWCGIILLALLKLIKKRKTFVYFIYGCIAAGVLYRIVSIYAFDSIWVVSLNPIAHLDAFGVGAILAINAQENRVSIKKSLVACVTGIGLILASVMYLSVINHVSFLHGYQLLSSSRNYLTNAFTGNIYLYISILSVGLVGVLYNHDVINDSLTKTYQKNCLVLIGDNSYSLYLFHWPILVVVKRVIGNSYLLFFSVFVFSIIATILFRKIMDWYQIKRRKGTV